MISLVSRLAVFPSGMFDLNISQDGNFGWVLLTWHPENDPVLEEIQTQIKLDIRNSAVGQTSKLEIESWLKNFFTEYHWKLHAVFRKSNLREKGISLFLAVLFEQEMFLVEFGRMLCGVIDKDGIRPAGRNWSNFHVKSIEEMSLLGLLEDDIPVKPSRLFLQANHKFIALPSVFSDKLLKSGPDNETVDSLAQSVMPDTDGCYFMLVGKPKLKQPRRNRIKKYQISALIIIVFTLLTIAYMNYGNRWLESASRRLKLLLTGKSRLTVEQIPQYLQIQSLSIRKQLERIEHFANQPARSIRLTKSWETDLNYLVTAVPCFDIKNIYVVSENKLLAYDKSTKKLEWTREFEANIYKTVVMRGNVIVFLDNQQMIGLENGDRTAWVKTIDGKMTTRQLLMPMEITNADDPRINNSILVVPVERALKVYDINSGRVLSEIQFEKKVQYISRYDAFDNCFYVVVDDGILCISLDVFN